MDNYSKLMDNTANHCGPLPRRHRLLPAVESAGWLPHKRERVNFSFRSCNFSLILAGKGSYILGGRVWPVVAPCVLLQYPETVMNYGPETEWTELYLIYPARERAKLEESGVFDFVNQPVRPFQRTLEFEAALTAAKELLFCRQDNPRYADRLDLICWTLLESSFAEESAVSGADHAIAPIVLKTLEQNLAGGIAPGTLARLAGMSPSSLRRRWAKVYGDMTFSDYRDKVFLQKSKQLLIESDAPVKAIAGELGFADPYYFCRKFRQLAGETASEYRKKHFYPFK